ncbi:uncharacterized protein LOC114334484 [Diabrotica virgifera virgifera]|uniref:Uncharacterized protein LOC114334484 n=1 Tax=Diabrotica virgifera virgifera TaxID=50390 RepID=A0A6P7FVG1_DIAVI|nr:uncharacterized protein LOC114334484 [Diabrotica virgifera virgifera]
MYYELKLVAIYWFLVLIYTTYAIDNPKMSRKRALCGSRLTRMLNRFCLEYPSPSPESLYRNKRQIVKECCQQKCSLDYLLENYCETVNSAALEIYKNTEVDSSERYTMPRSSAENIRSRNSRQKQALALDNAPSELSTHGRYQHHRKKRNCKCKQLLKNEEKHKKEIRLLNLLKQRQYPVPDSKVEQADFQQPFIVNFP